jgi:hypothetical protein
MALRITRQQIVQASVGRAHHELHRARGVSGPSELDMGAHAVLKQMATWIRGEGHTKGPAKVLPSADPRALWCGQVDRPEQLEQRIGERASQLHDRWQGCDVHVREGAMRQYLRGGGHPPKAEPALAQAGDKLDCAHQLAEGLKARIEAKKARLASGEGLIAKSGDRASLALLEHQSRRLEKVQSALVEKAEQVVEEHGLTVDLLATAESVIDPFATAENSLRMLLYLWSWTQSPDYLATQQRAFFDAQREAHERDIESAEDRKLREVKELQKRALMLRG